MDHRYLKGEEKGKGMEGRGGGELKVEGGEGEKEPFASCTEVLILFCVVVNWRLDLLGSC